jgi:protein SCO1/2
MAEQKRRLQDAVSSDPNVAIVSHSVTPDIDSVEVMYAYGERHGAIKGRWYLLTGDKKEIYRLARKSYFAVVDGGGDGGPYDFIHTENFVLVDPLGQLRGFYDGTSADDVDRLMGDISILRKEFPISK